MSKLFVVVCWELLSMRPQQVFYSQNEGEEK